MPEHAIRELVATEYDFIAIMADLDQLAYRLSGIYMPEPQAASRQLYKVKDTVASILKKLDGPISDAVQAAEQLEPAPF